MHGNSYLVIINPSKEERRAMESLSKQYGHWMEIMQQVEKEKTQMSGQSDMNEQLETIEAVFNELESSLQARKKECMNKLEELSSQRRALLDKQMDQIKSHLSFLRENMQLQNQVMTDAVTYPAKEVNDRKIRKEKMLEIEKSVKTHGKQMDTTLRLRSVDLWFTYDKKKYAKLLAKMKHFDTNVWALSLSNEDDVLYSSLSKGDLTTSSSSSSSALTAALTHTQVPHASHHSHYPSRAQSQLHHARVHSHPNFALAYTTTSATSVAVCEDKEDNEELIVRVEGSVPPPPVPVPPPRPNYDDGNDQNDQNDQNDHNTDQHDNNNNNNNNHVRSHSRRDDNNNSDKHKHDEFKVIRSPTTKSMSQIQERFRTAMEGDVHLLQRLRQQSNGNDVCTNPPHNSHMSWSDNGFGNSRAEELSVSLSTSTDTSSIAASSVSTATTMNTAMTTITTTTATTAEHVSFKSTNGGMDETAIKKTTVAPMAVRNNSTLIDYTSSSSRLLNVWWQNKVNQLT
ncbi:hypothetical protein RFI_22715 [Reticulomyxa filosa]|uniref:Uncharacterized protein n=1 Tax=Reticulomyxa filosa TaxID=46433 RepID=X6MNG9_RETFI|nr:hypothetical protein RFI_22715 [Reticulomyxa filosa]|eukprot:ETO14650.1 hypothetical protein RFI_22715 [Reticulomyxa filosa]